METKQATHGANKKSYIFALITVLSIFAMGQIAGSIDAAIELIGRNFHLDQSTTMFVSSIAALASVVFGLVVGMIAGKKVSFLDLIQQHLTVGGDILPLICNRICACHHILNSLDGFFVCGRDILFGQSIDLCGIRCNDQLTGGIADK